MPWMTTTFWIIGCLLQFGFLLGEALVASSCFNQITKTLKIHCGLGKMIRVDETFFGHSPTGLCEFSKGDCILYEHNNNDCMGRSNCTINLPTGEAGGILPSCNKRSSYLQVVYSCVDESQTADICTKDTMRSQAGYIRSPNYPLNYPENLHCQLSIHVSPKQQLKIFAVDLRVEGHPNCTDYLYIQSLSSSTICQNRTNEQVFRTTENSILLTFHSDGSHSGKGFWLYYEAIPLYSTSPSTIASTSASPTITSSSSVSKDSTTPQTNTKINKDVQNSKSSRFPIEMVIGVVLGSLLFIMLLLLLVLLLRRRREGKLRQSDSQCQQLNTAIMSKSGLSFSHNNIDTC